MPSRNVKLLTLKLW